MYIFLIYTNSASVSCSSNNKSFKQKALQTCYAKDIFHTKELFNLIQAAAISI